MLLPAKSFRIFGLPMIAMVSDLSFDIQGCWNECFLAAAHHYLAICRILLLAHDPLTPVLGPGRTAALAEMDRHIKQLILRICGIAQSNRRFILIMFTAGISIAMCKFHLSHTDLVMIWLS